MERRNRRAPAAVTAAEHDWGELHVSRRQQPEVENDLIASHLVMIARPHVAQFGAPPGRS